MLFGGKVKGINRRGGGALFCDFISTKWSAFILILIETILKGKILQPLGANSSFKSSVYWEKVSISGNPLPVSLSKLPLKYISCIHSN